MKYSELKTKNEKVAFIRERLASDPRWAVRGLIRIYEFQTSSEKAVGTTTDHNEVGFSGVDGEILSSFAEQVQKGRQMSIKQMALIFKKMPKYSGQLVRIAETVE